MPDGGFFEKIGAALAGGLLVIYGAVKALSTRRKEEESWQQLKEAINELCDVSERNREDEGILQQQMGLLMGASKSQGQEIGDLKVGQAQLVERVEHVSSRVDRLEELGDADGQRRRGSK